MEGIEEIDMDSRWLDIGPGDYPAKGGKNFETMDSVPGPGIDIVASWGTDRLPIEDNTYDLIHCSHVIEHIPWHDVHEALKEIYRILKTGGKFEVHTIDFEFMVKCYLKKEAADDWDAQGKIEKGNWMHWVTGRIFACANKGEQYWHKALFDEAYLRECLTKAGFQNHKLRRMTRADVRGHNHGKVNLGIEAIK